MLSVTTLTPLTAQQVERPSVHLAVRTAGERTTESAIALWSSLLPGVPYLTVVRERPFEASLRACLRSGANSGAPWLLVVDADELPRQSAVSDLLQKAVAAGQNVFQVQGWVLDRFSGFRKAGARLYRSSLISKMLDCVPCDGEDLRPETRMLRRMEAKGFQSLRVQSVISLHDYEQYYRDIYRKAFFHGHKHLAWVPRVVPEWKMLAAKNLDYAYALAGLSHGLRDYSSTVADIAAMPSLPHEYANFREKSFLSADAITFDMIESLIETAGPPPFSVRPTEKPASARLRTRLRRLGPLRTTFWLAGRIAESAGVAAQNVADPESQRQS